MAATTTTAGYTARSASTDRSTGVRRFTETKAGYKTTEFMVAVVFAVACIVAAYASKTDAFTTTEGWRFASFAIAAYLISRGLAKIGVREPSND